MRRIHLDTDIGGDADDLCALAMLLADPEVEIVGITTCAYGTGNRAALARFALELAGRPDIPVARGASWFLGGVPHEPGMQDDRYWPGLQFDEPKPSGDAIDLLLANAAAGATVVAIGPFTNLAIAETMRPGVLTDVVVMGGYTGPLPGDFPRWGPDVDYNVQADRVAARIVFERLDPLIASINACIPVTLRDADVPALRAGGPLAKLIAEQGLLQAAGSQLPSLARTNRGWPPDILNVHWDPVACAAALGWDCTETERVHLRLDERADGAVEFVADADAPGRRMVTGVDAEAFRRRWVELVARV